MKNLIAFVLGFVPLLGLGQNLDSLRVVAEVDSLVLLGRKLSDQGKYQEALNVFIHAKAIAEAKLQSAPECISKCLFNQSKTYYLKGDVDSAKIQLAYAKQFQENRVGKLHPEYGRMLNLLANINHESGEYEAAILYHNEALAVRMSLYGENHYEYAQSLSNLGNVYRDMGDFEKAINLKIKAKDIRENVLGKESIEYGMSLYNLATIYTDRGDYKKALQYLEEVRLIRKKMHGEKHKEYSMVLSEIGNVYYHMKEKDTAIQYYSESMNITKEAVGVKHSEYASIIDNIANIYNDIGELEKALPLRMEAMEIWLNLYGPKSRSYLITLNNTANTLHAMKRYEESFILQSECKKTKLEVLGRFHPSTILSTDNLAMLSYDKGDTSQASINVIESTFALKTLLKKNATFSSDKEILKYKSTVKERFDNLLFLAQIYRTDSLKIVAYENALFLNNAQLFNAVAREKIIKNADSLTKSVYLEWKNSQKKLGQIYSQPSSNHEPELVAQLEDDADNLEKELISLLPDFDQIYSEAHWGDVKSNLHLNEIAIEFVQYNINRPPHHNDSNQYAALVLLPNATAPAFIPLCQEADLLAVLDQPQGYKQGYYDRLYRGIKPRANAKTEGLYQLLWQPLDSLLRGVNRVYYAPSGLLHRINLAAIPTPDKSGTVGSTHELVQLGSTRQLVIKNEQAYAAKDAVVLGGIRYDSEQAGPPPMDSLAEGDNLMAFGNSTSFGELPRNLRGGEWNYLEGTEKEAADVAKLLKKKGFQVERQGGHTATEEAFKALGQNGPSPRVLHVATHGFFFPDPETGGSQQSAVGSSEPVFKQSDNPMIRSGLILAGANPVWKGELTPEGKEDGILTAYEISQMNLQNTELVVLSACETGLGDIQGNEGVYGLQRAFKIAGAKHLMMSLWDVPDAETAEFMTRFYKAWLGGKKIYEAFRSTQQAMQEAYPNEPYLWAGWVLVE